MATRERSPEMAQIGRIRGLATFLRATSQPAAAYPHIAKLSAGEVIDAIYFASGRYPWPSRWTARLYHLAKDG